jgi:hypothetical protein
MNHIYLNKDIQPKGASVVYWIHAPEHKDILNEGYVGITKNGVNHRWRQHSRDIRNFNNQHKVYETLKQQPTLIFEIVVIAKSREYCEDIENKLRPTHGIGWNVAKGGRDGFAVASGQLMRERWHKIVTPCERWYKVEIKLLFKLYKEQKKKQEQLVKQEHYPQRWQTVRKPRKGSKSGLTGTNYFPKYNLYRSQIMIDGKHATLGYYQTKEEAHEKYLRAKALISKFRETRATSKWLIAQVNAQEQPILV